MSAFDDGRYADVPVLVLGAAGFVGRWVARALNRKRARLVLGVRDDQSARDVFDRYGVRGDIVAANLSSVDSVHRLVERVRPAVCFNLIGYGVDPTERDEQAARWLNADLVDALADALSRYAAPGWPGQQLVHTGSALEYGTAAGDLAEDTTPEPTTAYGRTKLAGTYALARRHSEGTIRGVCARLFTVYGPGEHAGRLLPSLLEAATNDRPVPLSAGAQQRDFTWIGDVADGLLGLGSARDVEGPVVNLATGRLTTVRGFAETAAAVLGIAHERLCFGALPTRAEEMAHLPVSVARCREVLGWTPGTEIATGVQQTRAFLAGDGVGASSQGEADECE